MSPRSVTRSNARTEPRVARDSRAAFTTKRYGRDVDGLRRESVDTRSIPRHSVAPDCQAPVLTGGARSIGGRAAPRFVTGQCLRNLYALSSVYFCDDRWPLRLPAN